MDRLLHSDYYWGIKQKKVVPVKNMWHNLPLLSPPFPSKKIPTKNKDSAPIPKPTILGNHQLSWIMSFPLSLLYASPFLPLALDCQAVACFPHYLPSKDAFKSRSGQVPIARLICVFQPGNHREVRINHVDPERPLDIFVWITSK